MAKTLPERHAGRGADQYMVRFPDGMRENLAKLATANGRSMNAEILAALEKHLERDDKISKLEKDIGQLRLKFEDLEAKVKDVLSRMSISETSAAKVHSVLYGAPPTEKKRTLKRP